MTGGEDDHYLYEADVLLYAQDGDVVIRKIRSEGDESVSTWPFETYEPQSLATLDAGTYWIGDPSYSFAPDQWAVLLEKGKWWRGVIRAEVDGQGFVAVVTEAGDGIYSDADGFEYAVDSGMLGVTPARPDSKKPKFVREVTFPDSVTVEWKPFQLQVGDVEVDLRARSLT